MRDDFTDKPAKSQSKRMSGLKIFLLLGFAGIAGLSLIGIITERPQSAQQATGYIKPETNPTETNISQSGHPAGSPRSVTTPTSRESIQKELDEGNALMAENAKYLRVVKSSWKFDESHRHVVWTVTIENKSDAPIGNIIFSTRYADRHGTVLQFHNGENADEANRRDLGIDGPIKAHSNKTFTVLDDITEPMVILDAEKASFTIVAAGDWMQRVVK